MNAFGRWQRWRWTRSTRPRWSSRAAARSSTRMRPRADSSGPVRSSARRTQGSGRSPRCAKAVSSSVPGDFPPGLARRGDGRHPGQGPRTLEAHPPAAGGARARISRTDQRSHRRVSRNPETYRRVSRRRGLRQSWGREPRDPHRPSSRSVAVVAQCALNVRSMCAQCALSVQRPEVYLSLR